MKKNVWDLYAPLYERVMRPDERAYGYMYDRIPEQIRGKVVLELATGPGLLAKRVAPAAKRLIATDYSEGMIAVAKRGDCPQNLVFEVADATALPYQNASFDVVIIANALHLIPDPKLALDEIGRVLRPDGLLIAPNFVSHGDGLGSRMWSGILRMAGIRFEHRWSGEEYLRFLDDQGWSTVLFKQLSARIPLLYAECRKKEKTESEEEKGGTIGKKESGCGSTSG